MLDKPKSKPEFPDNLKYKHMLIEGDQSQIAINTDLSRNYISKIVNGHRPMNPRVLEEIIRFGAFNYLKRNRFDV